MKLAAYFPLLSLARRTRSGATGLLLLAAGLGGSFQLPAQDTNTPPATNEVSQADDMTTAQDNGQDDQITSEDKAGTNDVASTNAPGTPEDARTRRLRRQRQHRSRAAMPAGEAGAGGPVTSPLDYSAFKLVAERNIFDPNRTPHSAGPAVQAKTTDSFSLVGTLSYSKGDFAFFDGTSADYKKVLKPNDTIAGYKVVEVRPDSVKLGQGTNEVNLAVGVQMRHQESGGWLPSGDATPYAASSSSTSNPAASASAATGAESDVLKRLMERREKE